MSQILVRKHEDFYLVTNGKGRVQGNPTFDNPIEAHDIESGEIVKLYFSESGSLVSKKIMEIEYKGEVLLIDSSSKYKMNPNQVVIQAFTSNKEPFATLTKCLPDTQLLINETVLDEPNVPGMLKVLVSSGLVEDTGQKIEMGFNTYPIVKMINTSYPS